MYTILHLEQSEFIKKMTQSILTEKGYNYVSVDTAEELYNILDSNIYNVNLIITSMLIIDDNIDHFMKTINQNNRDIPVFVITSNDVDEYKKHVLNLGVSDYITKEDLPNELLKHVEVVAKEDELMNNLRTASIAVLDDNKLELKIVKDILDKHDVKNVDYYLTGKELLESSKKYDLYLIDIVLQKEFGKNIILNIRRNNLNASIIVVSSLTNTKTISSILNAGANDYIRKPFVEDIFLAKLKSNMRVYALVKEIDKLAIELVEKSN